MVTKMRKYDWLIFFALGVLVIAFAAYMGTGNMEP
jgi:hypothetical protein